VLTVASTVLYTCVLTCQFLGINEKIQIKKLLSAKFCNKSTLKKFCLNIDISNDLLWLAE